MTAIDDRQMAGWGAQAPVVVATARDEGEGEDNNKNSPREKRRKHGRFQQLHVRLKGALLTHPMKTIFGS